jgi:LTXXQ motif family protein
MRKRTAMLVLTAALATAIPIIAGAEENKGQPRGAPARAAPAPARPATPAARPAAPAPHIAAPARPAPTPRIAAPARPAPAPRIAAPHPAPAARVTPQFAPQRAAVPHNQPAAVVHRNVQQRPLRQQEQRQVRQQERALSRQPVQPTAQARPSLQTQTQTRPSVQTQAQSQLNSRQQLRVERALRRSEDRELRRLPPSQRAQRREEIRNVREQRVLSRQQLVQPSAQSNARTFRATRLNGSARVTPEAARQGRFAARFAQRAAGIGTRSQYDYVAAHHAWRHGRRAAFVAWFGPVFWPYAYSDIFDYAFWPHGYDAGYWAYAYDDFFDGLFWGEAGPPMDYAYAAPSAQPITQRPSYAAVQELCRQPGSGVTAWPFADIERKVGLDAEQNRLLGDVRKASQDAAAVFKASCPAENAFPLTPPGRLAAMTARLDATLQAVQTVRPALEKFYASLSDEQKERFNQLGPKNTATNAEASAASQAAETCRQPKQGLANLPIEKIEDAVNPTGAQEAELGRLQDATSKAVSIMQAACPDEIPITPPGRLNAMEGRLKAMIDAAETVKPALESFYASLSSEQKARFNRIGRSLAETTGQSSN